MEQIFQNIDKINMKGDSLCSLGEFTCAFLKRHDLLVNHLFPEIEKKIHSKNFQIMFSSIYKKQLGKNNLIEITLSEFIALKKAELLEFSGIMYVLNNSYRNINGFDGEEYISKYYHLYSIGNVLFSDFLRNKSKVDFLNQVVADKVLELYTSIDVDIQDDDSQFRKYKILSLNENIKICNDKDSQTIFDKRIGKFFWLDTPRIVLSAIENLLSEELINRNSLSFNISDISDLVPFFEEMELGSIFSSDVIELPELSKFYSCEQYDDHLWVQHNVQKSSITFEETLHDFDVVEDHVVTQVVHFEYFNKEGEYFISHIDHEFIVYLIDDYAERIRDYSVKGHKKIKTFKIDKSNIPLNYKYQGRNFLLLVLDSYFSNKHLVAEYFSKI